MGVTWSEMPNYAFMNGSIISLSPKTYSDYTAYRQYMAEDTIYPGVYVDDIHVGGMSVQEAKADGYGRHFQHNRECR